MGELVLSFLIGVSIASLCVVLGYFLAQKKGLLAEPVQKEHTPKPFTKSKPFKNRKTPVSISEEEQWKREQNKPPLDPGLG